MTFPPHGYTLRWFAHIFDQNNFVSGFFTSLQVGVAAMIGGLAARRAGEPRARAPQVSGARGAQHAALLPLVVPGVVAGTAIYVFQIEVELATEWPLLGSRAGLILAHIMITIPWTVRLLTASLAGFDRSVEEAALNLGATPLQAFLKVTLPVIKPGVVAAALFGFIISFGNLEMTLFLVAPGQTTLPIAILQYLQWRIDPTIAAVSLLQIVLIGAGMLDHRSLREAHARAVARPMARLQLTGLTKAYGDVRAVAGVDLDIAQGELVVLLGPSGCGKTTTLRMIAGFVAPTAGEIRLGGRDITRQPPWKRNTGLVFQSYALFPHLTVARERRVRPEDAQAAAVGNRRRGSPRRCAWSGSRASPSACRANCRADSSSAWRLPARCHRARHPAARRAAVQSRRQAARRKCASRSASCRRSSGLTTVMVTHDQEEALTMADRLVVMSEGQVQQIGTQRDLYERPANTFVAGFVGRTNFLQGRVEVARRFPHRERACDPLPRRRPRRRPHAGTAARAPVALHGAGRRRQLPSRHRRVRLVSRRHPGILCALDAAGPADGAGAEPDRRRRACRRRSRSICTGRPRPASCSPMMAAARAT